jgi:hypothetical protein
MEGVLLFQGSGYRDGREDMSAGAAACYDDPLTHVGSPPVALTLRATLRMMPIARQVNRKELPPMLTSGRVTPGDRETG